jgi:hypothetical protein
MIFSKRCLLGEAAKSGFPRSTEFKLRNPLIHIHFRMEMGCNWPQTSICDGFRSTLIYGDENALDIFVAGIRPRKTPQEKPSLIV